MTELSNKVQEPQVEIIKPTDKVDNESLYICETEGCHWIGINSERKRTRDNEKKGYYRTCPGCGGKDFTKITSKEYTMRTFSIAPDIEDIIRKYTAFHGLPYKVN